MTRRTWTDYVETFSRILGMRSSSPTSREKSASGTRGRPTSWGADNGPGVPDSHKNEIFGQGEKGLGSDGTGMGLYLVKTLVERYGGAVWVEDTDPEGSVFVVELPRDN